MAMGPTSAPRAPLGPMRERGMQLRVDVAAARRGEKGNENIDPGENLGTKKGPGWQATLKYLLERERPRRRPRKIPKHVRKKGGPNGNR